MSFLKSEKKDYPFVVFDIGSASVGAALVLDSKNSIAPNILYNTRVPIVLQKPLKFESFFNAMKVALKNATSNIERDGIRRFSNNQVHKKDIKKVFCVVSSSWYVATADQLKFEKDESFTISPEFLTDITRGIDDEFKKSLKPKFEEKNIENPTLIEEEVIQILLNGYNTDKPFGKKVKRIDITLFMSMLSKNTQKDIEQILQKTFSVADVSFNTFALASFSVIRDIFSTEKNSLLIDISGEVTDIILIRDQTILKMDSFPLGRNFLIRKIAEYLNTIPEEAHSIMRLFLEGKSTKQELKNVEKILISVKEEWLSSFRRILENFSDGLSLPKTIFLTVDVDIGKWFIETMKNDSFSSYTLAQQPFTIVELSSRIINKYCYVPGEGVSGLDPFLAIEAIFFHKIINA